LTYSSEQLAAIRSLSFDCYGTLIDWETGIRRALDALASASGGLAIDQREFFDTYLETEAAIEAGPYRPYKDVLCGVQVELARRYGLTVPADRARLLAESVAGWTPFADTNDALARLKRRFRLGVVSNIDRDLFGWTARHFAAAIGQFDFVIAAEDVESYKPAHPHFLRLLEAEVQEAGTHLHVAQSLFHDGVPAEELNIPFAWINRRNEVNETAATPVAEFANLAGLADWLGV
jgi:2-haloacid dehalogenase